MNTKPDTMALATTIEASQIQEALSKIPTGYGHHLLNNEDGTYTLSIWIDA